MLVIKLIIAMQLLFFIPCVLGEGPIPWNTPYPHKNEKENVLYSAFTERPKHLDPALSYASDEATFTYQIYEAPLQYDYFARPYTPVPLIAASMPQVTYYDAQGKLLNIDNTVAYTVYRITIKPGIFYHAHPAFAQNADNTYRYHALTESEIKNIDTLGDLKSRGTRELVAEDFVYEIKRLADPRVNSPIAGLMKNYIEGFSELSERLEKAKLKNPDLRDFPLSGARSIDKYTYEIKIKEKYPQFLYWLTMPFFAPMPWEAEKFYSQAGLLKKNISLDWYPVGTGPFMLVENNPNSQMVLARNPTFHGERFPLPADPELQKIMKNKIGQPLPFLDKIVFILEKESIPYWNKFLQGYYDRANVTSNNFDQALKIASGDGLVLSDEMTKKGIRLDTSVGSSIFYWGFNMLDETVGGYSDRQKKLRQALSIALDLGEYIDIFMNGRGKVANGPLAPGIFGFDESVHEKKKPIRVAKQLLTEAGYSNGIDPKTKQPLILYYDTVSSGSPDSAAQLTWFRKQFKKLGIDLIIRDTQYSRFQDKMANGDFQIFSWGWNADYPDPENFLFLLYSKNARVKHEGENVSNYHNAEFDKLFEEMKGMPNSPQRQTVIDKMISILQIDCPWMGGFHPITYSLSHQWVGPTVPNEMARNVIKYMSLDPVLREEKRAQWNKPIVWPIYIGLLLFLIFCLPAGVHYWRKLNIPLALKPPLPLPQRKKT